MKKKRNKITQMKQMLAMLLTFVLCIGCLPTVSVKAASVTVTFNSNGGSQGGDSKTVEVGSDITFPEYEGTKSGYAFAGWSTDKDATGLGVNHQRASVYQPGETYTVNAKTTFYAVWAKTNQTSSFYLRLDGRIPQEPAAVGEEGNYNSDSYTKGVTIQNVLKEAKFYANTTGVEDNLNNFPTNAQLVAMINDSSSELGFTAKVENGNVVVDSITDSSTNVEKYNVAKGDQLYVVWYVVKQAKSGPLLSGYESSTWHVDGVLLTRAKVTLTYSSGDAPAGVVSNMPIGTQWNVGSNVVVGTNDTENNTIKEPVRSDGYTFNGWEMYTKDIDDNYTVDKGQYNTNDNFTISEDTLLVAQWVKGTNVLNFKKTDQDGKALAGASFTISTEGKENITFTTGENGTYTGNFENQTMYTVTETEAPAGYQKIDSFNFMVTTGTDGNLGVYAVDADRNIVDTPEGVRLSYVNGIVNMTVADQGEFYVYYSHDQSVKTFNMTDTFDITKGVTDGYLYGGYYSGYKKAGTYTGGPTATKDGTNYKGAIAGYWDSSKAYTEVKGTEIKPVAGRTYYLKEVPEDYFQPYMQLVYDERSNPVNQVVKMYLISATDDKNYEDFGLEAINTYTQEKEYALSFKLQEKVNVSNITTITAKSAFGVSNGYLGVWNANEELKENNNFYYRPYVITPDGVTVRGIKTRTVYTGNVTYTGSLDSGDGVYKVDNQ